MHCVPHGAASRALLDQVLPEPFQIVVPGDLTTTAGFGDRVTGLRVLSVPVPGLARSECRKAKEQLGEESLIFIDHVHTGKVALEATDSFGPITSHQNIGGAWRRILTPQKREQERG